MAKVKFSSCAGLALMMALVLLTAIRPGVQAQGSGLLTCPEAVSPGDLATIQGSGFRPGTVIKQLLWDDVTLAWSPAGLTVGGDGRFTLSFSAPSDSYTLHTLVATDAGGSWGECYLNLLPRNPTPTRTPTPTLTPTPTPTWTPGPPPGVIVNPTPTPAAGVYCAAITAAFSRDPLAGSAVQVGVDVTNINLAWPAARMQVGLWQHYQSVETDTRERAEAPALTGGGSATLSFSFVENETGPIWYQLRLVDTITGQVSACGVSPWYQVNVRSGVPAAPALLYPAGNSWLNTRQVALDWSPAAVPDGATPVDRYQVRLTAGGSDLIDQVVGSTPTIFNDTLPADYGANQLSWQARAGNSYGWGEWAAPVAFGLDTGLPGVTLNVDGVTGSNGWYISAVTAQVNGSDPAPGSGVVAAFFQPGSVPWQQVIPGADNPVSREGILNLRAYTQDRALNRSAVTVSPVKIDRTAPEQVTLDLTGARLTASGWYTAPVTVNVTGSDSVSGLAEGRVQLDGGGWQTAPWLLSTAGVHTLDYLAVDEAGNSSASRSATLRLDAGPPAAGLTFAGFLCQLCDPASLAVTVSDPDSGLGHWTLAASGPGMSQETILASGGSSSIVALAGRDFATGTLTLTLTVQDQAGWLAQDVITLINGGPDPGPTPTPRPFPGPTATLWPTPATQRTPTAIATPTRASDDNDEGDDDGDDDDGGKTVAPNYPVGSQVVPVLLPITGQNDSVTGGLILLIVIFLAIGGFVWITWDEEKGG